MKLLAIDFGMKRVGFAIGNTLLDTANPIEPVIRQSSKQVIGCIRELIGEYSITGVVLGYPLNMNGTKSNFTRQVEYFARRLKRALEPGIPVELVDERLSSFEAEEKMKKYVHFNSYKKRQKIIDSMSALV
ncbi:MAG: Holliday junction resolvase RuvX, partial [bacterium]|nr:Holliday junction resolvase RuvX [bacterium]